MTQQPYAWGEDTALLVEVVRSLMPVSLAVEVGCGRGYVAEELCGKADGVIGLDVQWEALQSSKERLRPHMAAVDLIQGDGLACLRPSRTISLVVSNPPYLPNDEGMFDPAIHGGPAGYETALKILEESVELMGGGLNAVIILSSLSNPSRLIEWAGQKRIQVSTVGRRRLFFEELVCLAFRMPAGQPQGPLGTT